MQRNQVHRYRHRNTSLPEDMRSAPAFTTYEMVFSTREGATFGWSTEAGRSDYSGRTGYFSKPNDLTDDGDPRDDSALDLSGSSNPLLTNTVILTEKIQTVTAESFTTQSPTTDAGPPPYLIGPPQSAAVGESLPTSTGLSTSSTSFVNEGTSTVPNPPSATVPSTSPSTYTGDASSLVSTVPTVMASSSTPSPLSTAQQSSVSYGNLTCENGRGCAAMEGGKDNHSGMIAGAVAGAIAGIVLILTALMLWRRARKRVSNRRYPVNDLAWHEISKSQGSTSTATDGKISEEYAAKKPSDRDLGEPGPSFDFGEMTTTNTKTAYPYASLRSDQKSSHPNCSRNSPDRLYSTTGTNNDEHNTLSKISIALTRYSTTDSTAPLSRPFTFANYPMAPTLPKEDVPSGHKRHSSMSAQSDATIRQEAEVVYVGKARTARRHSLTPRVINIVAAGGSSDQLDLSRSNSDSSPEPQDDLNRDALRSRSMSPDKILSGYASFVNGLSDHLNTKSSGDCSSQSDQINRSSTTKTTSKEPGERPMIPTRGRSMKRKADQHISYPPTSYPKLGKTMSEVKKTIREKGDSAFASSDDLWDQTRTQGRRSGGLVAELPSTVTITRGGGRN